MYVSGLARACITQLGFDGAAPKTLEEYDRIYRQYVAFLTEIAGCTDDVRHFTPSTVQGFVRHLAESGMKRSTIRQKLCALSTLGKYGQRQRTTRDRPVLPENPTKAFAWPKRQRPRQDFLHPEELRAFMATPRKYPGEAIARDLLIDTGLRVSELCRANVEDFVQLGGSWVLFVTVKGEGRQDERVPCPISNEVAEVTATWLRTRPVPFWRRGEPEPLLVNTLGERYRRLALGDVVRRIGKAAGITRIVVSPHKLRRTANVVARFADVDSLTRSRLLNHLDPGTIRAYDALIPGELARAREATRTVGLVRYLAGQELSNGSSALDDSSPESEGSVASVRAVSESA